MARINAHNSEFPPNSPPSFALFSHKTCLRVFQPPASTFPPTSFRKLHEPNVPFCRLVKFQAAVALCWHAVASQSSRQESHRLLAAARINIRHELAQTCFSVDSQRI
ncbi:hypothetical protein Zmor_007686 [Zophobas morio]|uniref:Uncharacterized protein n=1 Tax=Zophobas morio TaxID=2755281 RepID=A0AA38IX77_9CUCU|nr:hypothetical protein Zmor_007686 [Zophobas morio]